MGKQDLEDFAAELRRLRDLAGSPAYKELERLSATSGPVRLAEITVSEKLAGQSAPSWEFVVAFLEACGAFAREHGIPFEDELADLDRWRARHEALLADLSEQPSAPLGSRSVEAAPPVESSAIPVESSAIPVEGPAGTERDVVAPTRDVVERAYGTLEPLAATLLRRLAVAEEVDLPRALMSALIEDASEAELGAAANHLVAASLADASADGLRLPDVVRGFAREQAEREDSAEAIALARDRARRYFLLARGHRPRPEPMITSDYWTLRDRLDHAHYADAIAQFIRHRQTRPPLTIGLKAPWGAGKTSLMRMIQNNLDPQDDDRPPCPIRLDDDPVDKDRRRRFRDRVTNLEILHQADAQDASPGRLRAVLAEGAPILADDWRPTVWFNPWMYQSGEQVWAGLAHEIITQVTDRLVLADRELFWLRLNLARIDRSALRRRWYRLLAERLLPVLAVWAVAVLITLAVQAFAPLREALSGVLTAIFGGGTLATLAVLAGQAWSFLARTATGPLAALVRKPDILGGSRNLLADQAKAGFDQILPDPGYASRLGFLHLVQTDMKRVLELIATKRRPLVVFVDDLDRCSPGTVTQVIEAVNLFLAGEFHNCVFVLGMEPGAVAAHVEVAYDKLVQAQKPVGEGSSLGWRFMEKLIQLPVTIPAPRHDLADYLSSLVEQATPGTSLATPAPSGGAAPASPGPSRDPAVTGGTATPSGQGRPSPEEVAAIEQEIRDRHPTPDTLREVALEVQLERLGLPAPLRPVTLAAADRVVSDLYSDLDALATLKQTMPMLSSRNPREVKRLVNLYRFYTFIAERQRLIGEESPDPAQIAKLAILAIRWPHLTGTLAPADGEHPLARLERCARENRQDDWPRAFQADTMAPPRCGGELWQFLREGAELGACASWLA
ncbi:P-loop NTPase fold protein [Nonomuraea sediminis]|uniref:P-loop NTPase fold protein n=1 Tax=Nonomuraea sediminis TaxID=2835864 RepID=UPI001BDDB7B4|nr:P-loop NTPase fold protein [Nonomuraea sediminis]